MQNVEQRPNHKTAVKTKKGSRNPISSFIAKTYEILEDAQFTDIVDWNPEGTAIIVKKPLEFAQQVLSVYFKHRNLTSFIRQLNMYNFHKQRTNKLEHVYCHELFQRDKKHLLDQIKRKNQEQFIPESDTQEKTEDIEQGDLNQDIPTLLQERQALKRFSTQASTKINCLEGKVKDLSLQNEALKQQVKQQSERDKILISLMANILKKYGIPPTELSSIVNPNQRQSLSQHQDNNITCEPSQMESDVGKFFNFGSDSSVTKAASTIFNPKPNIDAPRDISPSGFMKAESSYQAQYELTNRYDPQYRNKYEVSHHVINNGRSQFKADHWNNFAGSNLGKRIFDGEKEIEAGQGFAYEVLKKKIDFNQRNGF